MRRFPRLMTESERELRFRFAEVIGVLLAYLYDNPGLRDWLLSIAADLELAVLAS